MLSTGAEYRGPGRPGVLGPQAHVGPQTRTVPAQRHLRPLGPNGPTRPSRNCTVHLHGHKGALSDVREHHTPGIGGKEGYARGCTTPRTPDAPGLPKGAGEAPTGGAMQRMVLYMRCKHVRTGDPQWRQKSVQRGIVMLRGCEAEGRRLDTTLAGPATTGCTSVTCMNR